MVRRSGGWLSGMVSVAILGAVAAPARADDWPQYRGPKRDGVWREQGIVERFSGPQLPIKWRVTVSNGYSSPTVADGRVFVTDRVTEPKSQERVHCFAAADGKPLWSHVYDANYGGVQVPNGPRASVTVDEGRAYSLGTVGHLFCFEAATGKVLWGRDLQKEYRIRMPDWGIAAAPLVEKELLILHVGGEDGACFVALDKKTGQERWKALNDRPSYSPPVLIEQADQRVLVCWTAERLAGLDPMTGKLHWEYPFPSKMNIDQVVMPVVSGDLLYVSAVYEGSLMLRLAKDRLAVEQVWERNLQTPRETDGIQILMANPLLFEGHVFGINYFGELRCLDALTGKRVWENTTIMPRANWATAHLIRHGSRTWLFNEKGQLIIANVSPKGYEEISRTQLIRPTMGQLNQRGGVCWSHPAFANQHVFVRNDEELVCASLRAG
jgi:outer membrane protein assembly factor BamB